VRSRCVVLGAVAILSLAGCTNQDNRAEAEALPPVGLIEQPAASAGGACILWDYKFIKEKIGVMFNVAASDQVDSTSTCVVQTVSGDWPDLALSVVESTKATPKQFAAELMPAKATKLTGLGSAGYRLNIGSSDNHGPVVEIGWLSEAKQLQTLRFTFPKDPKPEAITAMNAGLLALAKAMDTTNG
jgi:hypothetical protein